jgi:hypothetical protein
VDACARASQPICRAGRTTAGLRRRQLRLCGWEHCNASVLEARTTKARTYSPEGVTSTAALMDISASSPTPSAMSPPYPPGFGVTAHHSERARCGGRYARAAVM